VDVDAEFKAEAKSISAVTLSCMVALLKRKGYKLTPSKAALMFTGKDFINHGKERRLFEPLAVAELKREADKRNIKTNGLKNEALISELLKPDKETTRTSGSKRKSKKANEDITPELMPMLALFKQPSCVHKRKNHACLQQ
jgi:hypothetical protein